MIQFDTMLNAAVMKVEHRPEFELTKDTHT